MKEVIVYTKPQCVQCDAVKRKFNQAGIDYTEKQLIELPREAVEEFMEAGHRAAPIVSVITDNGELYDEFSGFNPAKVGETIDYMRGGGDGPAAA